MRILITGNMGYVGPAVIRYLREFYPGAHLVGFDNAYFGSSITTNGILPEVLLDAQYYGDVRKFPEKLLDGVDTVVHLAAISNDPIGNLYEEVTKDILAIVNEVN